LREFFWLFGLRESGLESWRKEWSIFINWHKYPYIYTPIYIITCLRLREGKKEGVVKLHCTKLGKEKKKMKLEIEKIKREKQQRNSNINKMQ